MTNFDEAKLTAYALGELSPAEAAEVEAHLKADPDAQHAVDEMRHVAGLVTDQLAAEPTLTLTNAQRSAVQIRPARPPRVRRFLRPALAAAAVLIVGLTLVAVFLPIWGPRELHREVTDSRWNKRDGRYSEGESLDSTGYVSPSPTADEFVEETEGMVTRVYDIQDLVIEVPDFEGPRMDVGEVVSDPSAAPPPVAVRRMLRNTGMSSDEDPFAWADVRQQSPEWNREAYEHLQDNPFKTVAGHPLSTFSIDVDTASYSNVRRMLNSGRLPPAGAVRIEEMVNYFSYSYVGPSEGDAHPFSVHTDVAACPWQQGHQLLRVAIKGVEIEPDQRPAGNFVFLLDVSGSMEPANKLPLVRSAMKMLVQRLNAQDRLAIVVYAGAAGMVLDSTTCDQKDTIIAALERLQAGGSTHGAEGIRLAYEVAQANFIDGGVNRVILCTDGDFNVGVTSEDELVRLIEDKAETGVFLSVLGFGMGNLQDDRLESLADKGNGNYGYIDTINEARKLLVDQMAGTLVTIAKDVKIQIEFNPARVAGYRLIGYENRILAAEDFNDDTIDAGEIGAGHTVTALYELVPAGQDVPAAEVDPLRYQQPPAIAEGSEFADELLMVKLRYKQPDGDTSTLIEMPLEDTGQAFETMSEDFRFAASVAAFGMILRGSPYKGVATLDGIIEAASAARGDDANGYRAEFVQLARTARELQPAPEASPDEP